MTITNKLDLPSGFVKAVSTEKHNAALCLSATTLLRGMKEIILTDRHWDELADDVSDRIWAIWGQAVHSLLESEGEDDFTEQEMSHKIGDITITGKIDNYDMKHAVISDYKTASVNKVKFGDFSDWHMQGMIYAWLLSHSNFPVKHCRFIALLKDHSKTEMMKDHQYPRQPVYVYDFPVTQEGLFKTGAFIRKKAEEYLEYRNSSDDAIPPCSPEERWERPAKFAVMKSGQKRAVRLFDDRQSAELFADGKGGEHYIEDRPGESIKCRGYCLCNNFCNFYRQNVSPSSQAAFESTEEKAAA